MELETLGAASNHSTAHIWLKTPKLSAVGTIGFFWLARPTSNWQTRRWHMFEETHKWFGFPR